MKSVNKHLDVIKSEKKLNEKTTKSEKPQVEEPITGNEVKQ